MDGLWLEFDLVVVHLLSKLDSETFDITLTKTKFFLQKYEERLIRNYVYTFDVVGGFANIANRIPKYMSNIDLDSVGDRSKGFMTYIASFENFDSINSYTV